MSSKPLLNMTMHDGSRHFAALPCASDEIAQSELVRDWVGQLPGARVTGFLSNQTVDVWIDFAYDDHSFAINNQYGQWWFFVDDPSCPDDVLHHVVAHFEALLAPPRT